ncbi:J domain-containing protein [Hymenobacter sp. YC55]|uniref:J domain-containing protein n=1 Tax=Hymenobacter sp. YC55 TaxID=3034019 RepID=UPI0023F91E6C|nr:J domain-containing protein [Hymenobacter sp. YC55]MDF7812923.1 J domain-containing protein [Hymenobacter sp. YC55]
MTTYYAILGVSEQATPDDIRRAYRRLALLTHPDRTPDPAAHQRFIAVNEAYEALNEPTRRYFYDSQLREMRNRVRPLQPGQPPVAARAPRRPPPPPIWRRRSYVPKRLNFPAYARTAKRWGKWLAVLPALILLDFFVLRHYATADFISIGTSRDGAGNLYNWVVTSQGEFNTLAEIPLSTSGFRVRTSWLFKFIHEAYLPDGTWLPIHATHGSLLAFTTLLLLLAAATQAKHLSDAARVNVAIVGAAVGIILLLMALSGT